MWAANTAGTLIEFYGVYLVSIAGTRENEGGLHLNVPVFENCVVRLKLKGRGLRPR